MLRNAIARRPGASSAPTAAGSSMMQQLLGGRQIRYNRAFDKLKSPDLVFKVPADFSADEHNVIFALGRQQIAAGAQFTYTANAPRDIILRDLTIDELGLAFGAAGSADATILGFTVEGNALALGNGAGITEFSSRAINKPALDLPVAGGTPVSITIGNNSAGPLVFNPTFAID